MSRKGDLDEAYARGSQTAADREWGVNPYDHGSDERRAYDDGFYHTKGQIDNNDGKYSGFSISSWFGGNSEEEQANLDAYNEGHSADIRGSDPWWKIW